MNTHQTDDVITGYRKATDAQQRIIQELRAEISSLKAGGCARDQSTTQFCAEAVRVEEKLGAMQRHVERCRQIVKCPDDETLAEWLKGFVRLDDPVVTGLVEALKSANKWVVRVDDRQDDLPGNFIPFGTDPAGSVRGTRDALSAYGARVKSIWPTLQNHGHMDIDYKYNNETTTMSPARVKEVGK